MNAWLQQGCSPWIQAHIQERQGASENSWCKAAPGGKALQCMYIYICCRQGIWSPGGPFFVKKMLLAAEPSISSKGILPKKRGTKFKVFGDQVPWLVGPNSLTYFFRFNTHLSTFVSMARNPYFCSVFLKFCVLHEDISKMARNACQKECYYLVKCARGDFCAGTKSPYVRYSRFRRLACWSPFFLPKPLFL